MGVARTAATVGAVALLLAGCSSAGADSAATPSVDPSSLLTQAKANATAASSVHIRGTGTCPEGQFVVDMQLSKDDTASGSVTFQGATINVVATRDQLLLHAPQSFWAVQSSKAVAARIGDKWLRISRATNPCINALTSLTNVRANYLGYPGTPVLQTGTSFKGVAARQVGLGPDVAYWIQTSGTLLPINVHDATTQTDVAMEAWNSPVSVVIPPDREIIDAATANKG